jgi:predicted transposase YbfD/YdcC
LEEKSYYSQAIDKDIQEEKSKGRETKVTVEVWDDLSCVNQNYWRGVKSIIRVTRFGKREGKPYQEKIFYLSSLKMTAQEFGIKIREHWKIENQLHWVKDVVLQEDKSRIRSGKAPQNMAIIRSIVINIFRKNGIKSITEGLRMLSNNIKYLFGLVILEIEE